MIVTRLVLVVLAISLGGCVVTKVVTVPMRVVGAVVSIVPVVGDALDESIETVADAVDDIPI
jgi:alpha-beta hydrolase superfamily lysophospholipase